MTPTPTFHRMMKVRRGLFREELLALSTDGQIYVWERLPGWNTWHWRPLNNDNANRLGFAGDA